jgi:S-adenosylmethionine synthetase
MIHFAEAVLPGHPDKLCDHIADAIVAEALAADPEAFAQIEVGVWADEAWLSGNIVTRQPLARAPAEILVETATRLGCDQHNWVDASRYRITDTVCRNIDDPSEGRGICDDQCIVIGYAGYDLKTRFLPPEQFLVHSLADDLDKACFTGALKTCGPDGKILITMREESQQWILESILVTLQHPRDRSLMNLTQDVHQCLRQTYKQMQAADGRWRAKWEDIAVLVNPNGPHYRGGSDGDNGQTGRKLVMDYYGPRISLGGGALAGKHPAHIDRMAARAARLAAIRSVQSGAGECTIRLAYAPNRNGPLQEVWEMAGRGARPQSGCFNFDAMVAGVQGNLPLTEQGKGVFHWAIPND